MNDPQDQYRAVQAIAPGELVLTELPLREPPRGHVRIRVEACGVCHSDGATVDALFPVDYPRVPGHEVVGRIDSVGEGVEDWKESDRVGVGWLGGQCNHCATAAGATSSTARTSRSPASTPTAATPR